MSFTAWPTDKWSKVSIYFCLKYENTFQELVPSFIENCGAIGKPFKTLMNIEPNRNPPILIHRI